MNKYRELAAAIRKGHTMIGEITSTFLHSDCGCALGAAWVGVGKTHEEFHKLLAGELYATPFMAPVFGLPVDFLRTVSSKHMHGMKRLAIADWLDTLADEEEGKPVREDDLAYAKRKVSELLETVTA